MEDTFNVRVDRTFGSLQAPASSSSSQPIPSSLTSLWSLTDEEIERNKWIHDKVDPNKDRDDYIHRLKNPKPYSPILQGLVDEPSNSDRNKENLESDLQELDDDVDEDDDDGDGNRQLVKPDDHSVEEWDIRSSVGLDCTLDNEEEEDAYDKVAVGKEESADRFYMKSVNDYEVETDSNNELPSSFRDVIRDPRANHMAAKLRLKEDDESAKKLGLQIAKNSIQDPNQTAIESKEQLVIKNTPGVKDATFPPQVSSSVPDYVRNPSKYTHYTLDSLDDVDEEANKKAYMNFFSSLKKGSDAMEIEDDVSTETATSIVFTPRKKSGDVLMKSKVDEHENKKVVPISIGDGEVSVMDEDETELTTNRISSVQKSGRRYRTKGSTSLE